MVRNETLHGEATGGVKGLHEAEPNAAGAAERSPMWLLVIVLLNIVPGLEKITVLNTFATSGECQVNEIASPLRWRQPIPMTVILLLPVD